MRTTALLSFISLLAIAVSACGTKTPRSYQPAGNSAGQFVQAKLDNNTVSMLCDQPSYRNCFGVTRSQCIHDLGEKKQICTSYARSKLPYGVQSRDQAHIYSTDLLVCYLAAHTKIQKMEVSGITQCLKKSSFDREQVRQSLMQ